jgi:hypothetical protein
MSSTHKPPIYKGRNFGIVLLVAIQVLVGVIHVFFGFWLFSGPRIQPFALFSGDFFANDVYATYTILFAVFTLVFSYGLWMQRRWGWLGTAAILLFVTVADSLTLLDLPSIPGIPKAAGYGEITYSILVLLYISQAHIRAQYKIRKT